MDVVRSDAVFASWDGASTLSIAVAQHFDADDSLAQMLFHEICHALVAGEARARRDWGLGDDDENDLVFEHATHRLQAALSGAHGLREFMAVTTEWRPYWDELPRNPLAPGTDPAIELARRAHERAQRSPWREVLSEALSATARIADAVRPWVNERSLWSRTRARHRNGLLLSSEEQICGDCTWAYTSRGKLHCRRSKSGERTSLAVSADERACEAWEPVLSESDCGRCGACCREGFDLVPVGVREPFRRQHPELVASSEVGAHVPRPGGRCVALAGMGTETEPFRCSHYAERPRACAAFPVAGDSCLLARRRVGLTR